MTQNDAEGKKWDVVIKPQSSLLNLHLTDLWRYHDLILSFIKRDFVSFYKQTILGPIWYIIQPVASSIILYIVFNKIANLPTGNIPPFLFYFSGNLLWIYFSENIIKTSETFIQNANIFGKVYFPRLTVPVSISFSGLIAFFIQFALFLGFYIHFLLKTGSSGPGIRILFLPAIILQLIINSFSAGIIIAALTNKYRDLRFTLKFGIQLWMFASPIAYSTSQVPAQYLNLYMLNPVTPAIEGFRNIFFGTGIITTEQLTVSVFTSVFLCFVGLILFNRVEKTFMDTV